MQNYCFSTLAKYLFMGVLSIVFIACSENSSSASEEFDAAKVCPESGRGTFIDERDGQEYKYTTIGNQVWMAQNLNYKTSYSMKHEGEYIDCSECGLWYNLGINLPKRDIIDSVCPLGWRVPTEKDWNELLNLIGSHTLVLRVLISEFYSDKYSGSNECGFNGIESGQILVPVSNFKEPTYIRGGAYWWTQTVTSPTDMIHMDFLPSNNTIEYTEYINRYFSTLRCIKN